MALITVTEDFESGAAGQLYVAPGQTEDSGFYVSGSGHVNLTASPARGTLAAVTDIDATQIGWLGPQVNVPLDPPVFTTIEEVYDFSGGYGYDLAGFKALVVSIFGSEQAYIDLLNAQGAAGQLKNVPIREVSAWYRCTSPTAPQGSPFVGDFFAWTYLIDTERINIGFRDRRSLAGTTDSYVNNPPDVEFFVENQFGPATFPVESNNQFPGFSIPLDTWLKYTIKMPAIEANTSGGGFHGTITVEIHNAAGALLHTSDYVQTMVYDESPNSYFQLYWPHPTAVGWMIDDIAITYDDFTAPVEPPVEQEIVSALKTTRRRFMQPK